MEGSEGIKFQIGLSFQKKLKLTWTGGHISRGGRGRRGFEGLGSAPPYVIRFSPIAPRYVT